MHTQPRIGPTLCGWGFCPFLNHRFVVPFFGCNQDMLRHDLQRLERGFACCTSGLPVGWYSGAARILSTVVHNVGVKPCWCGAPTSTPPSDGCGLNARPRGAPCRPMPFFDRPFQKDKKKETGQLCTDCRLPVLMSVQEWASSLAPSHVQPVCDRIRWSHDDECSFSFHPPVLRCLFDRMATVTGVAHC